jgi:hypothetical protein
MGTISQWKDEFAEERMDVAVQVPEKTGGAGSRVHGEFLALARRRAEPQIQSGVGTPGHH